MMETFALGRRIVDRKNPLSSSSEITLTPISAFCFSNLTRFFSLTRKSIPLKFKMLLNLM